MRWIIGISGSDMDDVITYAVTGSKDAVKRHLIELVKKDKSKDSGAWDDGSLKPSEVEERQNGKLYAFGNYAEYHCDYTATPLKAPVPVSILDITKCKFCDAIPVDKDGNINTTSEGVYGYKVFYTVPRSELRKTGLFEKLPKNCCGGELEFMADKDGEHLQHTLNEDGTDRYYQTLLWLSKEEQGETENTDFVEVFDDISLFEYDFKKIVASEDFRANH